MDTFIWRDPLLQPEALQQQLTQSLAQRTGDLPETHRDLLDERWGPLAEDWRDTRLALHFMGRFAAITERLPKGLAYTALTTMRLERPLGQQEEFNRAALLYCHTLTAELQRLQQRLSELEKKCSPE